MTCAGDMQVRLGIVFCPMYVLLVKNLRSIAFKGHHVPESQIAPCKGIQDVLDSGFHYLNSGIQVMNSGSLSVELGFPIPII